MRLLAIRHGQASAGSANYDQLSARGVEQSQRLGAWLAKHGVQPDRVLIGAMQRHRQTLDALCQAAGPNLPEAECLPALNEFDHDAIIAAFCQRFPQHPACAIAAAPWQAAPPKIRQLIHAALTAWCRNQLDDDPRVEAWPLFRQRVREVFEALNQDQREHDVLMVSSGGVLTQLLLLALDLPDARATEFNLGIRNSALCEFVRHDGCLRMLSWNSLPHLADAPALWTHY